MANLSGKVAAVTGGSRGIGAAVAKKLALDGARVAVVARDAAAVSAVAEGIVASGGEASGIACDVSVLASVENMVQETERALGPIDVLVNNAGIIEPIGRLSETEPDAWVQNIQINLVGAYYCVRAVLPAMVAGGAGTIINVSSGAAHRPLEGWSAYCAGKAGLAMLTESLRLEAAGAGIRIFGLSPGTIDTDMQVAIRGSGINPVSQIPRADLAPVENPALAISYLCTSAADDLAGQEVSLGNADFRRRIGLR